MILPRIKKREKEEKQLTSAVPPAEKPLNMKTITWGNLTWIDIMPPTERETKYLADNYHFHPLDLDDCLSRRQLAKVDEYKDYLFWIFHFPIYNKESRVSSHRQLAAFIGNGYLITLHTGELRSIMGLFRECEIDEEARRENFAHGSGYLLFQIVDKAVDHYFLILDKIMRLIEDVEDNVFDEHVEAAHELTILRRDILTQRRIVFPMRTVFNDLFHRLGKFIDTDMTVYFGDLMDHMNKICETLDEAKEVIEVYKDTDYLLSNYRLNRVTRAFTLVSAFVLPFLVVSSIYGMNIFLPGGVGGEGSYVTFAVLLFIMVGIIGAILYFFRHKRLI